MNNRDRVTLEVVSVSSIFTRNLYVRLKRMGDTLNLRVMRDELVLERATEPNEDAGGETPQTST